MISYADFLNEAKKKKEEQSKWFGKDKLDKPSTPYEYGYDYGDEDYDYDGDYDYDYDGDDGDYYGGGGYGGGGYGYGYEEKFDYRKVGFKPTQEFNKGDVVIYKGRTGHHGDKGIVHKIRDDGKVLIKFEKGSKLLAASKHYVFLEKDMKKSRNLKLNGKKRNRKKKKKEKKK
jgi:hypothetical protein